MKTLKEFNDVVDAGVVKSALAAAGIESWILDEATATVGYGGAVLGVRLGVQDDDLEQAVKVLKGVSADQSERGEEERGTRGSVEALRVIMGPFLAAVALLVAVSVLGLVFEALAEKHGFPEPYAWFGAMVLGLLATIAFYLARISARLN